MAPCSVVTPLSATLVKTDMYLFPLKCFAKDCKTILFIFVFFKCTLKIILHNIWWKHYYIILLLNVKVSIGKEKYVFRLHSYKKQLYVIVLKYENEFIWIDYEKN